MEELVARVNRLEERISALEMRRTTSGNAQAVINEINELLNNNAVSTTAVRSAKLSRNKNAASTTAVRSAKLSRNNTRKTKRSEAAAAWNNFVRAVQEETGLSYREAMVEARRRINVDPTIVKRYIEK